MKPENKFKPIAFLVHAAEMCNHYKSVWRLLGRDEFDTVLHGTVSEIAESRSLIESMGYTCYESKTIIDNSHKYDIVVSNHSMFDYGDKPLIHAIGDRQVRFMYALGKEKHNFSDWNKHYDLVLCFGPWQADRMNDLYSVATFQMGYPRYDDYFRELDCKNIYSAELGLEPDKKTILWLPTWLELSSLALYSDVMSTLCEKYNVIVKTHPLSATSEPDVLERLKQYHFTTVITDVYDNIKLFRCADFVVCDYGGTPFGAIYLDKNLLLLDIQDAEKNELTGAGSPDVNLRSDIVHLDYSSRYRLPEMLLDETIWDNQKRVRQHLRRKYFTASYGFSAEMAIVALKNIEHLIKQR
ncbi:CDP-glycerol glycerophosphotransferase family protein [Aeromonas sp. R5-3]|uniref:CDP-glycerol glycerophosphotransferase family protein n=1 Tax=Aeromonas sp. R5-3 TaxID=3138469 RepID=UPI0034A48AFE